MYEKIVFDTPEDEKPLLKLLEMQEVFQDDVYQIALANDFAHQDTAFAAAMACAFAIDKTQTMLDPHISIGIAAYGVLQGIKTTPPPLG